MFSTIDQHILQFLYDLSSTTSVGNGLARFWASYLIIIMFIVGIVAVMSDRRPGIPLRSKQIVALSALSIVLATAIGFLIAAAVARERPFLIDPVIFTPPLKKPGNSAFPSAHTWTAFAFAFSIYFQERYRAVGRWLIGGAVLVGIGRVMIGFHYPSDVVAGALLGMGSAYAVLYYADDIARMLIRMRRN